MLHTQDVLIPFSSSYSSMLWAHKLSGSFHSNRLLAMRDGSMSNRGEFKVMQKFSERTQGQRYFVQRGSIGMDSQLPGLMLLVMFLTNLCFLALSPSKGCMLFWPNARTSAANSPTSQISNRSHLWLRSELGRILCSPRCMNSVPWLQIGGWTWCPELWLEMIWVSQRLIWCTKDSRNASNRQQLSDILSTSLVWHIEVNPYKAVLTRQSSYLQCRNS